MFEKTETWNIDVWENYIYIEAVQVAIVSVPADRLSKQPTYFPFQQQMPIQKPSCSHC